MPVVYPTFYYQRTAHPPHPWQAELAADWRCRDRLIRVPTGMGKTLGVLAAWAFHRLGRADPTWPRRLVLCLPMRVLVEQTEAVVRDFLQKMDRLWDPATAPTPGRVGVHLLLGGAAPRDWHLYPEQEAVLIGTQDMLLSRALGRGYASPRARWPMESALLRQDALWVFDEVQLMDVGLRTAVQLQAFHPPREIAPARPLVSWWMSATLQPKWLHTVDFAAHLPALEQTAVRIPPSDRQGPLFAARKPLRLVDLPRDNDREAAAWARLVLDEHHQAEAGAYGRITLAIANTVDDARALHSALQAALKKQHDRPAPQLHLIHSRFRPHERRTWREQFLNREACTPGVDRILVATQVVEAGVDISATALVTQLAPWPSLVQRFGRAARYGGLARVTVVDRQLSERAALPYEGGQLQAARRVLEGLTDVGLTSLEALEDHLAAHDPAQLARLYPYDPLHTLTRRDLDDLFDTGPDLTGADLDVSRFIRSGDDRDLHVWWVELGPDESPAPALQPTRAALCAVPIKDAGAWLIGKDSASSLRAWIWSYLQGKWLPLKNERDLIPGRIMLVDAAAGGYTPDSGFVGAQSRAPVQPVPTAPPTPRPTLEQSLLHADSAQDHEDLSELAPQDHYKTIAFHGYEAAQEAEQLAAALALPAPFPDLLQLAARLHDLGKAHPVFQAAIVNRAPALSEHQDLAKAPGAAWKRPSPYSRRGFRHELASVLALFEALYQSAPDHPALLGPFAPLIESGALFLENDVDLGHLHATRSAPTGVLAELCELAPSDLDLVLYLVCAHHGKIRGTWQPTPDDQNSTASGPHGELPLRGVHQGDRFPATALRDATGAPHLLPELHLHLDPARLGLSPRYGVSWRERVHNLRARLGDPFLLLLESLLRVADVRASIRHTVDPTLTP